jgi:hypothetical protein
MIAAISAGPVPAGGAAGAMSVRHDKDAGKVDVFCGGEPVLRYNFATVPVPAALKGKKYAEARSDYIHPLYGPAGEALTVDYAKDHPHHRGVYWAWPEVYYKGQVRDLHALQGLFARPSKLISAAAAGDAARIEAENIWKWDDTEPIVREGATIRVSAAGGGGYFVDFEFRFEALVDGVSVARRGQKAYGGLNIRTALMGEQKILEHTDPAGAWPRRSYAQIAGVPTGGKQPAAIAIIQHAGNPAYPGDWVKFANLGWLQPTFPASGDKFPLSKDKPLVLRYRLWVQPGHGAGDEQLAKAWDAYNKPAGGAAQDAVPAKAEKER